MNYDLEDIVGKKVLVGKVVGKVKRLKFDDKDIYAELESVFGTRKVFIAPDCSNLTVIGE